MDMRSQNVMKTLFQLENWTRYIVGLNQLWLKLMFKCIAKPRKQGEYVIQSPVWNRKTTTAARGLFYIL